MATRASPSLLQHLKDTIAVIAEPMPGVTTKRMFGCDVWLVNGNLFVLLMGYGRVVLRLPATSDELLAIDGAGPWVYGKKSPTHWIMVPEDFHDDVTLLRAWVRRAYAEVLANPPKTAAKKKTATTKKKKKATAKKSATTTTTTTKR